MMKQAHKVIAMAVLQEMKRRQLAEVERLNAEVDRLKREEKSFADQIFAIDAFLEIESASR